MRIVSGTVRGKKCMIPGETDKMHYPGRMTPPSLAPHSELVLAAL